MRRLAWIPRTYRVALQPALFLLLSTAGIFVPAPDWLILDFLAGKSEDAQSFVNTLWQVTAGAIALSVTVVVFAFQAIGNLQQPSTYDLWNRSRILWAIYLGISTLIVQTLVLLRFGTGSPGGWPGTWATFLAIGSFLLVAILFVVAISLVEPERLKQRRIRLATRQVRKEVEQVAVERLARVLLEEYSARLGFDFTEYVYPTRRVSRRVVTGLGSGTVYDINLRKVERYAGHARNSGVKLTLSVRIGRAVEVDTEVFSIEPKTYRPMKGTLRGALRIRPPRPVSGSQDLDSIIRELHDESVNAVRSGQTSSLSGVCDTYMELLLALPRVWKSYNQRYDSSVAGSMSPFGLAISDPVLRNIRTEASLAVQQGNPEVIEQLLFLPVSVAIEAHKLDAISLCRSMVNLVASFVYFDQLSTSDRLAQETVERSARLLFEYIGIVAGARFLYSLDLPSDDKEPEPYISDAFTAAAQILKYYIDTQQRIKHDNVFDVWRRTLRDEIHPSRRDRRLSANTRRIAGEIHERKAELEFALAVWAVRRVWGNGNNDPDRNAIARRWIAELPSIEQLFDVAGSILDSRSRILNDWILTDAPDDGEAHIIDVATPVLRLIAVAILAAAGATDEIPPVDWLQFRGGQLIQAMHDLRDSDTVSGSLGLTPDRVGSVDERVDAIRSAMSRGEADEARQVRALETSPDKIESFVSSIRESWSAGRDAGSLIHQFGRPTNGYELHFPVGPTSKLGLSIQLPSKGFFTEARPVYGADPFAAQLGTALVRGEDRALRDALDALLAQREGRMHADVLTALDDVVASGGEPNLVLLPYRGPFPGAVHVEQDGDGAPSIYVEYQGRRIAAVRSRLAYEKVIVMDCSLAVEWIEWPETDGHLPVCDIREFSDQEMEEIVDEYPNLFDASWTRDQSILQLGTRMRAEVYERVQIAIADPDVIAFASDSRARVQGVPPNLDNLDDFDELAND